MNKVARQINKICLAAMFLALCWLMPFLTASNPELGNMFLPMHIPVFIAGFVLGPFYGGLIGLLGPITRTLIFGAPPIFNSIPMCFELATYGFISGLSFSLLVKKLNKVDSLLAIYIALISAMVIGRIAGGFVSYIVTFFNANSNGYTWSAYWTSYFVMAWPGMILQLVVVPALIRLLYGLNLLKNTNTFNQIKEKNNNNTDNIKNDNK